MMRKGQYFLISVVSQILLPPLPHPKEKGMNYVIYRLAEQKLCKQK